jgi:FAD dependent oxidoreductase TIGR03364
MNKDHFDIAIVGGGIIGLAQAWERAKKGQKVILFERNPQAQGASIRNFGMIWPIGQPTDSYPVALKSREIWLELAEKANFWAAPTGSLHLAYHEDEWAILNEFHALYHNNPYSIELLTPKMVSQKSAAVKMDGLLGALFSTSEVNIDPRQAVWQIHKYLKEKMNVHIEYKTVISNIDYPKLISGEKVWHAEQIILCTGADLETLFPAYYQSLNLVKCKLQMMRTVPQPSSWNLGPNLAAGLTLLHYESFLECPSRSLLMKRIELTSPEYLKRGIHVMASQTAYKEITIGDSHHYGDTILPFDDQKTNQLILDYLKSFAHFPHSEIQSLWNGTYVKLPGKKWHIGSISSGISVVTGVGGAGMTLSFGLTDLTNK